MVPRAATSDPDETVPLIDAFAPITVPVLNDDTATNVPNVPDVTVTDPQERLVALRFVVV